MQPNFLPTMDRRLATILRRRARLERGDNREQSRWLRALKHKQAVDI
jgi:hypothetical protein